MAVHLSIGTALDKNRLAGSAVYLMLLEVDVVDPATGAVAETIRACMNNEPYVWAGSTYLNIPFEVTLTQEKDQAPTAQLVVYDLGQVFQAALQAYGWTLDWPARIKVINTQNPSATAEIEQDFSIIAANAKGDTYAITLTLGAENPLTLRFPPRQQFRNRCFWKYKDPASCGYAGAMASCDYSYDGANGCKAHNNVQNFGGFPGINRSSVNVAT